MELTDAQSLDILACALGFADWSELETRYEEPGFGAGMPILRVFDIDRARSFYENVPGFAIEFEHRFAPGIPTLLSAAGIRSFSG